jgi:hypothetical protein
MTAMIDDPMRMGVTARISGVAHNVTDLRPRDRLRERPAPPGPIERRKGRQIRGLRA